MNCTILLSFLVVIIGAGHAQIDPEFTARARQMLAIFDNQSVDNYTKNRNLPALVEFYEKYSNRLQLSSQDRSYANNVVRRYRAQKALKVDGVPAQGGFWLIIPLVLPFVVSIVEGIAKAVAN
ncbi:protein Turandot F-like [Drosophila subpulchrella]|uniref:protein Turandot F-like n=1 Tax=Drosophila subpulchrella TaxID=1486046 RepID=UPI0018A19425|nr:protein Turandot F-like [Drosophila subpulchrella]